MLRYIHIVRVLSFKRFNADALHAFLTVLVILKGYKIVVFITVITCNCTKHFPNTFSGN